MASLWAVTLLASSPLGWLASVQPQLKLATARKMCHMPLLMSDRSDEQEPEECPPALQDGSGAFAIFTEPGGEFEIDADRLEALRDGFRDFEERWNLPENRQYRKVGVLDDPSSTLHKWWNDPVDSPRVQAARYAAARQLKRVVSPIGNAGLIAAAIGSGYTAPAWAACLSARLGLSVHVGLPGACLLVAALRSWAAAVRRRLVPRSIPSTVTTATTTTAGQRRYAGATHVLSLQHLVGVAVSSLDRTRCTQMRFW